MAKGQGADRAHTLLHGQVSFDLSGSSRRWRGPLNGDHVVTVPACRARIVSAEGGYCDRRAWPMA